jgi:hypothetical protein
VATSARQVGRFEVRAVNSSPKPLIQTSALPLLPFPPIMFLLEPLGHVGSCGDVYR